MEKIHPSKVKVREGLERYRQDIQNLKELAESLKKHSQLVPIIVTREFELVAGGRRLAACLMENIEISYVFKDVASDLELREIEFEENRQRCDFTPAELAFAIEDIHKRRQEAFGTSVQGKPGFGWTVKQTADLLGYTQGAISQNLLIAETVKTFPNLAKCETASEIRQAVKGLQKKINREQALASIEKNNVLNMSHIFHLGDSFKWMHSLKENSVDILITDPPYGIDIGNIQCTGGKVTGGESFQGFKYDDTPDISIYRKLAECADIICKKDTAFAIIFISIDYFFELRNQFLQRNWDVSIRPLVWIKPGGSSNAPKVWPISSYEIAMFARRPKAYLQIEGFRDAITDVLPVHPTAKRHPSEKPVELFQKLLRVVGLPGQTMIDPFCGSGASLIAGLREKMVVKGCDILKECSDIVKERLLLEGIRE